MKGIKMSNFNWCHGPKCHEEHTVDRVRGVKGSKVLRTRKIKVNKWNSYHTPFKYFCSQRCYDDFSCKHIEQIIALEPRTECQETPIQDPTKETHTHEFSWGNHSYTTTEINVDESRQS